MSSILIPVPREFSFELCLAFLKRSPQELLHRQDENSVTKMLRFGDEKVLFDLRSEGDHLSVDVLTGTPSAEITQAIKDYVIEWLDLQTDLSPFYRLAGKDDLLKGLVKKYYGYRIVGQPDLFESLVWAVLGQQINLSFAYKLKYRFVEQFGESQEFGGHLHYLFPAAQRVSLIKPDQLLALQFSRQKASYTIGIAEAFAKGVMSKEKLNGLPLLQAREELMKIRGIGNWTANYGLMKTFRYPDAFPLEDAGLHNAIRIQLGLKAKPSLQRVKRIFKKYKGWEAYATLYLWKSL